MFWPPIAVTGQVNFPSCFDPLFFHCNGLRFEIWSLPPVSTGSNVIYLPTKNGKAIAKLDSGNPSGTSVFSPFLGIELFYGPPVIPNLLHLILTPSHSG